jgi:hypothetical protein
VTWTVNLAAGTQVLVVVEDEDADEAWSGVVRVSQTERFPFLAKLIVMADNRSLLATAMTPPA